jgi:hypothetical protein
MQFRSKDTLRDSEPICIRQSRPCPSCGKTVCKRPDKDFPPAVGLHSREVRVTQNEVHLQAWVPTFGVSMPFECRYEGLNILGCLQRIEVVRTLSNRDSKRLQIFQSVTITNARATPIITLKNDYWPVEVESRDRN